MCVYLYIYIEMSALLNRVVNVLWKEDGAKTRIERKFSINTY